MTENGKYNLLLVDDDCAICEYLEGEYSDRFHVNSANSHHEALKFLKENTPDIVLLDLKLTENGDDPDPNESVGFDLIKRIRRKDTRAHIIVMTAHHRTSETAVQAMKLGANDYIKKPFMKAEIPLDTKITEGIQRLCLLDDKSQTKGKTASTHSRSTQNSEAPVIAPPRQTLTEILEKIDSIAKKNCSVLITGETGVGKRYFADLIFKKSKPKGEFIPFNCSSNASLLESELFGYVKGAFTDAKSSKIGLIESADGGTLFLDEIGTMPTESQAKLLMFFDDRMVRPVGSTKGKEVNVRIISATNSDICKAISSGTFRDDLFHRLNVVWLNIPPLRERKQEIPALGNAFLRNELGPKYRNKKRISIAVYEQLKDYDWPGNVRELENAIKRAVALSKGRDLQLSDIIGCDGGAPELKAQRCATDR
jgi:DNA-binding NtrC family response regulator